VFGGAARAVPIKAAAASRAKAGKRFIGLLGKLRF